MSQTPQARIVFHRELTNGDGVFLCDKQCRPPRTRTWAGARGVVAQVSSEMNVSFAAAPLVDGNPELCVQELQQCPSLNSRSSGEPVAFQE